MLKASQLRVTGTQAKLGSLAPVRSLPTRALPSRKPQQQQAAALRSGPARRLGLRVQAAAEPASPSQPAQPLPLTALKPGQQLEGRVVRVEQFGAFVNVGATKDGLVHISQLSDGFVKNANAVVQPGQTVNVRVMSVDASTGRIALSMKGLGGEADEEEDAGAAEEEEEELEPVAVEEEEDDEIEPDEGNELVDADEEGDDMLYQMREEDPEISLENVAAFEAAGDNETDMEVDLSAGMPAGFLGTPVSGTITRVEDYGVFVEFQANGRSFTALLPGDEAKIPSAALAPEQLSKYVPEGEQPPAYIGEDVDNIRDYYKIGDTVHASILEYTEEGKIALTQWADWEVEEDAAEVEPEDETDLTVDEEGDPLAMDPLDLVDEDQAEDVVDEQAAQEEEDSSLFDVGSGMSRSDVKQAYMSSENQGRVLSNRMMDNMYTFMPRPLNKINPGALNARRIGFVDTDFDLDEIELNDFWQESVPVPKRALKMMGLKRVTNEQTGESELVEREGAQPREVDWSRALRYNREKEVAAFVDDLMAEEEDEAEVPVRAYRRPAVYAAAVQNVSAGDVKALRQQTGAGMMDCKKALAECQGDTGKAIEWLRQKGMMGADKKAGRLAAEGAVSAYIHPGSRLGVLMEVNCETDFVAASDKFQALVGELGMLVASTNVTCVSADDVPQEVLAREREIEMGKEDIKSKPEGVREKIVEGRLRKNLDDMALVNQQSLTDPNQKVGEIIKQTIAAVGENIQVRRFERYHLGEGLEKKSTNLAEEVAQQTKAKEEEVKAAEAAPKKEEEKKPEPEAPKAAVQVSSKAVQELRRKSGAGMMDCKKALAENNNDMEAASDWLRKKGLASADKKAGRVAAEGVIAAYIHPGSRLGVMLEVNCETDFVAASDQFNQLVSSIAMQIVASQTVEYVGPEDIPAEVYAREREIEMGREDLKSKPDAIRAKIAEGRTAKLAQEMTLLPQPFLADNSKTVEQAIKEVSAQVGEKISVRRFVKYLLGEGIEKKQTNLAEEVASIAGQTGSS